MKPQKHPPPKLADRFLRWFCKDELLEEILGDLQEYYEELAGQPNWKRSIFYWFHVFNFLRPFALKKLISNRLNHTIMLKHYFKISTRNLLKNKVYSIINIGGLAMGMSVTILIGLWIYDELSFNKYHENYERLAHVMSTQTYNGNTNTYPNIVVPLENELRTNYSADFKRLSLTWTGTHILSVGDKKISRSGKWAQPDFPKMLALKMLSGSLESFNDPSVILLSGSLAKVLFGDVDPINQMVRVDNKTEMRVGGVYEDLPHNTTFKDMKCLLPWYNKTNWWNTQTSQWRNHGCTLVAQLHDGVDFEQTSRKIRDVVNPHIGEFREYTSLHPMKQWHLYNEFKEGKVIGGQIQFVWLFGIIGIFVLLLACINFMNLSTARSEKRSKEVGIRKAIGSLRGQLTTQFLSESLTITLMSIIITLFLVQLLLPFFNELADKQMSVPWRSLLFWVLIVGFAFFTGMLSGSYPAFYLSGFNTLKVLKGTFREGKLGSIPRKILVIIQFSVSTAIIIGTIVVFQQVQYAKNRPVGYSREGLISIDMNTPDLYEHYNALRNDLIAQGGAADMAESNSSTTDVVINNNGVEWVGKNLDTDPLFGTIAVTHDFGKTIGWEIIAGRDFSREYPSDSGAFILNQAAVKLTGIEDPVGQIMKWRGKERKVVGVVKDMIMRSPYKPSHPTIFHMDYGYVNRIVVRIDPKMPIRQALTKMETVFKKYNPGGPFEYEFTDEAYAMKFSNEEQIGKLAFFFGILAIFISLLGLFGLASFVAEQRTKEIGIRKVIGASVFNLWKLLSKDFVVLVFMSCVVAMPCAYYLMDDWLENYEYRINIAWEIFLFTGIGTLLITLLTVSYQTIKAAIMNPVNSLRSE